MVPTGKHYLRLISRVACQSGYACKAGKADLAGATSGIDGKPAVTVMVAVIIAK